MKRESMMKRVIDILWVVLPVAAVCALLLWVQEDRLEPREAVEPPPSQSESVLAQSREEPVMRALSDLQRRVDEMARHTGGRYQFMVVKGRFIRLDTFEGKIAFYDDVSEASWITLRLKEQEVGPESGYYRNYVNFLRTLGQP